MRVRYLLQNLDWLDEALGDFSDDFLIIDCPGLFGHMQGLPS